MTSQPLSREPLSADERRRILQESVRRWGTVGYQAQTMDDTTAVLLRPAKRVNHILHLLLTLVTCLLWSPVWLYLAVMRQKPAVQLTLTVDEYGVVNQSW